MNSDIFLILCMLCAYAVGVAQGIVLERHDAPLRWLERRKPEWFEPKRRTRR